MKSITAKVKEVLQIKSLSRLVNVVQFNVRFPHDPEHVIVNPFENNHLPGIYRNLLIKYQKCTYVSFVGLLIQAINWSITDDIAIKNPLQAVSDVDNLYNIWKSRDVWSLMTEDLFFTTILLKGLPEKSLLRIHVSNETLKYIRDLDDGTRVLNNRLQLPIYNYATDLIKNYHENTQFAVKNNNQNNTSNVNFSNNKHNNNYNNRFNINGIFESAASVSFNTKTKNNYNKSDYKSNPTSTPQYNREIKKSENIMTTRYDRIHHKHKSIPYVAVSAPSDVCNKCFGTPSNPCQRDGQFCTILRCSKCNYYGHHSNSCLQSKKSDGTKIVDALSATA